MKSLRLLLVLTPIAAVGAITPSIANHGRDEGVMSGARGRLTLEGDVSAVDSINLASDAYALAAELAPIEVESLAMGDRFAMSSTIDEQFNDALFIDGVFDPAMDGALDWPGDVIFAPECVAVLTCDQPVATIAGAARLGGLAVIILPADVAAAPLAPGARFTILRAAAVTGRFGAIDVPGLPSHLTAGVEVGAHDVAVVIDAAE
jgi:hypothetical protein